MPCRDWDYSPGVREVENPDTKRKLDKVTRLLCTLCHALESSGNIYSFLDAETQVWWSKHKETDKERKNKARLEKEATKKLLQDRIRAAKRSLELLEKEKD